MMPNKLYLPTSTLNFNNLMSSESISAASFYTNRRFGYKRFEKVAPNNLDNSILLYDKYPIFEIDDKELENYPLVIEIDTHSVAEDSIQEKDGFFYSTKTIYINPFSSRIIFRTRMELTATLSKAEPSIESKLIPLYRGQIGVISNDIETFEWFPVDYVDLPDYDNRAVSFDIALNKLKGMLYGYLLGVNESSSQDVVTLKRKVKELRNSLAAIVASPNGRATDYQQQQLENLYSGINQNLYKLSGIESRINEIIAQKTEVYNTPLFVDILKGEGFYQEWFRRQVAGMNIKCRQINPFYLSHQSENKVEELDRYIDDIENVIQTYDVKTKVEISQLPIIRNHRIVEIPEQKSSLALLFNEYMDEMWNGTEFLSSRYEFAKVGGKFFRDQSGDKWENSPARTYINSLLKNLNEYTEFDLNSTESDILKSFAAFCQKGEADIDKLRDYLITNGIGDFRIAFALWGLVFGFAEMPKTLTNELYETQDNQYLSECYKYIHKQLHSVELEGTLDRESKENSAGFLSGLNNIGRRFIEAITQTGKTTEQTIGVEDTSAQRHPEHRVTTIPEELKLLFNSDAFKEMPLSAQQYYKKESLGLYNGVIDKSYIDSLKKLVHPETKTKTKWQNAIKVLAQKPKKKEKQGSAGQSMSLFSVTSTGEFLNDFDFLQNNAEFRSLVSGIKGWEKDLKWFIDAHNPNHEDYKYYEGKPMDNESVIKQFIFLKKEKYKHTESFLRKTYL